MGLYLLGHVYVYTCACVRICLCVYVCVRASVLVLQQAELTEAGAAMSTNYEVMQNQTEEAYRSHRYSTPA